MLLIQVYAIVGDQILGGALQGERLLADILACYKSTSTWTPPLVVDFESISLATASYLRTSVIAFRSIVSAEAPETPFIIANANPEIEDELLLLMERLGDVVMSCRHSGGKLHTPRLLGRLDPMMQVTLRSVLANEGPVDARALAMASGDLKSDGSRFTKWNNRLSYLAAKGILTATQVGRSKFYVPTIVGLENGT